MSSVTNVISNLQQANNCAGKCDCCAKLQSQINQIKAELKTIPRINESEIVRRTEASLFPKIPGFISPIFLRFEAKQIATQKELLEKIFKAESASRAASNAASSASAKAGNALSSIAKIGVALAGLAASVGVLRFTEGRFNAVERVTDGLGRDIDRVLAALGVVNSRALKAQSSADRAQSTAEKADDKAFDAQSKAGNANNTANKAIDTAQKASQQAQAATTQAQKASQQAQTATTRSEQAKNLAQRALNLIGVILPQVGALNVQVQRLQNLGRTVNQINQKVETIPAAQDMTQLQQQLNGINSKLDRLAGLAVPIGAIQNKVNGLPNAKEVRDAAQKGSCDTLNSPQCTVNLENRIAKDGQVIARQANDSLFKRMSNLFNAGANAAQLALLTKIDLKLGAQIAGGISGKLTKLGTWLQIDRALNLITTATTIHNAAMLSNNIGQTLGTAIGNILSLIGIKDENGSALNIGNIINGTVQNLMISVIGQANYTALTIEWAKANRIYQATINVLNNFQNLSNSILNGLEITAGRVGKIGNALRKAGEVLENSYSWMNPEPKFNRILGTLEQLDQTANTIVQVTQAPLDIINATTELTTATTELKNAMAADDNNANKGITEPAPTTLTQEQQISKNVSQGILTTVSDFFSAKN